MTKRLGWMLLIPALLLVAGCGRRTSDPESRLKGDLQRYGVQETVARAKDAVKADPSAANYDYLARALSRANQPKEARQALQKAVSLDPAYAPSSLLMARLLMDRGKTDAAEILTRRVLEKAPDSAAGNELLGRILLKQGKAADSETILTAAIKHNSRDARLQWALADTQSVLKRYEEALKHYRRAIKLDPDQLRIRMCLVQTLMAMGKQDQAAAEALTVVDKQPDSADVRFMAASALHELGRLDEAITQYREALVIDPSMVPAANNLALLLADQNQDIGTAVSWARKAAQLAPRNPAVSDTLGWALARSGAYSEAIGVLRRTQKSEPNNPAISYHLGWALAKSGQKAAGLPLLQKAAKSTNKEVSDQARKALQEFS